MVTDMLCDAPGNKFIKMDNVKNITIIRIMKHLKKHPYLLWAALLAALLMTSCDNDDNADSLPGEMIEVRVATPQITESGESTEITKSGAEAPKAQTVTVPAGNGMVLEATLKPDSVPATRGTTKLATGVKYRVIAFKQGDVSAAGYISHADYAVGTTGAIAGYLYAPAGSTYTFVCYSINSATALPVFSKNTLTIAANPTTNDLLYTRFDQNIISANETLSFCFKRQYSQITVIADASNMAQNITAISANLAPNYSALFNLDTGTLTAETLTARTIPWETITAKQVITSIPCTVFTNVNSAITVNIPLITIGGITKTNLTASFGSSSMQVGSKYTLRLIFKRFGGVTVDNLTWAPGNLIKSGNTYIFAVSQEYYSSVWNGGDYWNWCILDPTDCTNYGGSYDYNTNDPCRLVDPIGTWHIPSHEEFTTLIHSEFVYTTNKNGIKGMYFGTSDAATANANPNKYIFLPAAGFRWGREDMNERTVGSLGYYWTSTPSGYMKASCFFFDQIRPSDYYLELYSGLQIRCVKNDK